MYWKQKKDWWQRKYFHCRFKKGSSSTTVQSYTPTAEERRMMNQSADYAEAVAPNALALNNYAMGLLKDSLGTVQVDYNSMNKNAQNQIANATNNMAGLAGSNNNAAAQANTTLSGLANQAKTLGDTTAQGYGNLTGNYTQAADKANASLGELANGNLPSAYQQNMEKSIQSTLNNTLGKAVSSLGNRGVLNSSVTTGAINDIEKNASDAVAKQYQQNINQASQLGQQQYNNSVETANNLGNIIGKQQGALSESIGQQGTMAQEQLQNTANANSQNSGIYSNLINSASAPITTAAGAQEAAIAPAQSLWNSSLGLNGATNSALAAMAGKGTSTATQSMSGGGAGGFFSGLVGAAANSYGNLWCFPDGTKIVMADGTKRNIKHIHEGDKVLDGEGNEAEVIEVMKPHYNDVYNIVCKNGHTSTTLSQPLMKENGEYILTGDLRIGTALKNVGKVKSIIYSGERKVYDFKTNGKNQYVADGFIAMGGSPDIWDN